MKQINRWRLRFSE